MVLHFYERVFGRKSHFYEGVLLLQALNNTFIVTYYS